MAKAKAPEADPQGPTQEEILDAAQEMRRVHHTERGVAEADIKPWDELSEAKQQRWIDRVNGVED